MNNPPAVTTRLSVKIFQLATGNLIYLGAQFFVFILLAQLVSPSEVGVFSWALAIVSPVFVLAEMRTQQIQLSTLGTDYSYRVFWRQRLLLVSLTGLGLVAIGPFVSADSAALRVFYGVLTLKVLEGLLGVSLGELMRIESMAIVAKMQTLRSVCYLVPFGSVLLLTHSVALALVSTSAILVIPVFVAHWIARKLGQGKADWRDIYAVSREALPLGLGFFIGSLTVNAPRVVLEAQHGSTELATFAAVSYLVVVINQVVDSINQGVMPRMAALWRNSEASRLIRLTWLVILVMLAVGGIGALGSLVFGDWILGLVFGNFYGRSGDLLAIMLVSAVIMHLAQALRNMLIAGGFRGGVLTISGLNFLVSILAALVLIPDLAGIGIALALAMGQSVSLLIYITLSIRALGRLKRRSCAL